MTAVFMPYNMGSTGAKALATALGIKRVRLGSPLQRRATTIFNWGVAGDGIAMLRGCRLVNSFTPVSVARNKRATFNCLRFAGNIPLPDFTTEGGVASQWGAEGHIVMARQTLTGHSGAGIVVVHPGDPVPEAPLYTKYFKRSAEYRLHATQRGVFHVQIKRRRNGEDADRFVRNAANGWVYCIADATPPSCCSEAVVGAIRAVGLDFGAVDVVYNARTEQCAVLEINTAPGLEGTTVSKYAEMLNGI